MQFCQSTCINQQLSCSEMHPSDLSDTECRRLLKQEIQNRTKIFQALQGNTDLFCIPGGKPKT